MKIGARIGDDDFSVITAQNYAEGLKDELYIP
jgi:hypothetical protein